MCIRDRSKAELDKEKKALDRQKEGLDEAYKSVSYTHLDVYKRQVLQDIADIRMERVIKEEDVTGM